MKKLGAKIIFHLLLISVLFQPLFSLSQVKAETAPANGNGATAVTQSEEAVDDTAFSGDPNASQPASLSEVKYDLEIPGGSLPASLVDTVKVALSMNPDPDKTMGLGLEDGLAIANNPRLVINPSDFTAIKTLGILGTALPDFPNEYQLLFDNISNETKAKNSINNVDDVRNLKLTSPDAFEGLVHEAQEAWLKANSGNIKDIVKAKPELIARIMGCDDPNVPDCDYTMDKVNSILNYKTRNDTDAATYDEQQYDKLMADLDDAMAGLKIDVRVLELLNYLVTPKSQGGAGHWRVQVRDILAGYNSPRTQFNKESDINYVSNASVDTTNTNRTAAEIGQNRDASTNSAESGGTNTNSTIGNTDTDNSAANTETNNVDSYEASFSATGTVDSTEEKRLSAHSNGEAVDIAQIDDIRCTLIKKKRLGGDSVSKYSQRPIKLAWQTTQGYIDSGGQADQNADMAKILKDYAQDGIRSLIDQFGGNIQNYNGDLSSASFSDVAMLLGKSLFGEILNSPGGDLKGYSFGDTLEKLGAMYFADYLGLPREMFIDRQYDNLDQFEEAIGAAAIEKRMNLPIGTFDGDNLNDMLRNIGQRKVEYEMNLDAHDLDLYFVDVTLSLIPINQRPLIIGATVIEQDLGLEKGAYLSNNGAPANFVDLKKAIGKYKSDIIFKDPTYVDGVLHLEPGTTKQLISGQKTPEAFAIMIGQKRLDDTVYGLQFLAMNDAAYEIPEGTFQKVLDGDSDALIDIGVAQMAKVFTQTDQERQAFIQWIKANKDSDKCEIPESIQIGNIVTNTYLKDDNDRNVVCNASRSGSYNCTPEHYGEPIITGTTVDPKLITLSEKKALDAGFNTGDMYTLFGCNKGNGHAVFNRIGSNILYFAIIQQALTPEDKVKLDLTNLHPQFRSSDPQKQFYISRIYKLIETKNKLKSDWNKSNNDPQYIVIKNAIKNIVDTLDGVLSNPSNITDINSAKAAARSLGVSVNSFAGNVQQLQVGAIRYREDLDNLLIDVQDLTKTISEIMEGREIKQTNKMTIKEIPTNVFGGVSTVTNQSAAVLNQPTGVKTSTGIRPTNIALMAILSRGLSPTQFFTNLAATKIEGELNLPANSIVYFVNNYESKGLGGVESFVVATGQARIEEEFGMPANYFQGPILSGANFNLSRPDFKNDMYALEEYLDTKDLDALKLTIKQTPDSDSLTTQFPAQAQTGQILSSNAKINNPKYSKHSAFLEPEFADQYTNIFSEDGTPKPSTQLSSEQQEIVDTEHMANELLWLKISQPTVFNQYVAKANANFSADMQRLIDTENMNKYLENDVENIVTNIENFRLYDLSRSPSADLLFRMGITGSLSALESDSSVAWLGANARATQIDKIFGIAQGSTKQLLTSKKVSATYSHDSLTTDEKNLLSARMGVTTAALDKLLDVMSGNIPVSELDKKALDIVAIGDNPYLKSDTTDVSSDDCSIGYTQDPASGFLTSSTLIMNSYLYVDADGTHSFGSQTAALNYAQAHKNREITYADELGNGLGKVFHTAQVEPTEDVIVNGELVRNYAGDPNKSELAYITDENYQVIEQKTGITKDTWDKLFTRSEASDLTRPLVAYKKAVGNEVLFQTLSYKLFGDLGLRITRSSFHTSDFFDIMHGNFKSLEKIASSLIDDQLNLPAGSTQTIIFASSPQARSCALAEVGGNVLGKYLGLDYISLHGNIYQNLGRSNVERILGIPHNTFSGKDIDQLISGIGEINFVKAFSVPIDRLNFDDELSVLFDQKTLDGLKSYSNFYKLQLVQNLVNANIGMLLVSDKNAAYLGIKIKIRDQIKYAAAKVVKDGDWRKANFQLQTGENKAEINKFIVRIDSLDDSFHFTRFTTANMLAGIITSYSQEFGCSDDGVIQIDYCTSNSPTPRGCTCYDSRPVTVTLQNTKVTPNDYVNMAANNTAKDFLLLKGMEFFGLDSKDPRNQAIINVLDNFQRWITESNAGYAKLFSNLSIIFGINLDEKAGVDPGTFRAIIENPGNTFSILMPQATRKIDEQLKLDPNQTWSVSGVYRTYLSPNVTAPTGEEYKGAYAGSYGYPYNSPGTSQNPTDPLTLARDNAAARANDCPYTPADLTAINSLNAQAKAINDWLNMPEHRTYLTLIDETTSEGTHITVTQPNDFEKSQEYKDKMAALKEINIQRSIIDRKYNACKEANRGADSPYGTFTSRFNWNTFRSIAEDYASDYVHGQICDITGGRMASFSGACIPKDGRSIPIDMPPQDIKKFFTHGDMRYFWIASIAYTANYVINAANGDSDPLPPALRISYSDIYLATMSDSNAEEYAADAAIYDYVNNGDTRLYTDAFVDYRYGDLCYGDSGLIGSVADCITDQDFNNSTNSVSTFNNTSSVSNQQPLSGPPRDAQSLVAFNERTFDRIYNFGPAKRAQAQAAFNQAVADVQACSASTSADCTAKNDRLAEMIKVKEDARHQIRNSFLEDMEFRIFDGVFWGKDHNIFPGFTYALMRGSSHVKSQAIATYIKNGILNGQFFGQDIPWLKQFDVAEKLGALSVISFARDLFEAKNPSDRDTAFNKFASNQTGFNWFENFISTNSEKWFGFYINPQMAGGLVLGAATGHWGEFSNSDPTNVYTAGSVTMPTLGNAVWQWGSNRIFSWTDTQLGWSPGTAQKVYDFGKTVFEMNQTIKQIGNLKSFMDGGTAYASLEAAKSANPLGAAAMERSGWDGNKAKLAAKEVLGALVVNQLSTWINSYISNAFGKQIAGLEQKLGLVPGSTMILISAAVSYQVGVVVFNNTTLLAKAPNPATLYIALAIFVLVNLFGVYKVELKCDADGYYPRLESRSSNLDSNSGLGVWDGMNPTTNQEKTIAASQYKAKQLITDALTMHNNPNFSDVYPSQIMTGRDEDVLSLNQQIADNMCSVIDSKMASTHGICGGDSMAGVWYDSYVASRGYTHIGF